MNVILFDTAARKNLYPLTLTRAVADLRVGILTIKERWEKMLGQPVLILTEKYLQPLYGEIVAGEYIYIDARLIPDSKLVSDILMLQPGEAIEDDRGLVACRTSSNVSPSFEMMSLNFTHVSQILRVERLSFLFDLFRCNQEMIDLDFALITKGRTSANVDDTVKISNPSRTFIEEGATVSHTILNASTGPIYIGRNATVMEGCFIRGPFAMCEGAVLKMGTKVYGATTIGPYSMGGGEIKNSIITGYSNKAHDGYLGDSVLGEWCNMGAGTSNSNLKNTGGTVHLWNYSSQQFVPAGNKCGVIMGDYSRTAINSSVNTGSVIGTCCNVFGAGLLPRFIPDFSWGTGVGQDGRYQFQKALEDINNWKKMKNKAITEKETQVLKHIFDLSEEQDLRESLNS